jgi:hypothetical protein
MEGMVALEPVRGLFEDSAGRIWAGLRGAIAVIENDKVLIGETGSAGGAARGC